MLYADEIEVLKRKGSKKDNKKKVMLPTTLLLFINAIFFLENMSNSLADIPTFALSFYS